MNDFHDALNATQQATATREANRETNRLERGDMYEYDAETPVITPEMQSTATRELNAAVDQLGATALRIRDERDEMAAALRDLAFGATLLLDGGLLSGAFLSFVKEVKRVAEAGLREASVS
jgi:hypothetical protein